MAKRLTESHLRELKERIRFNKVVHQIPRDCTVNNIQTPEERREKYAFLRAHGWNSYEARRDRDFQWQNIFYVVSYWEVTGRHNGRLL